MADKHSDPSCFHCRISVMVQSEMNAGARASQLVVNLAQVIGEIVASVAPAGQVECLAKVAALRVEIEADEAAEHFRAKGRRRD